MGFQVLKLKQLRVKHDAEGHERNKDDKEVHDHHECRWVEIYRFAGSSLHIN